MLVKPLLFVLALSALVLSAHCNAWEENHSRLEAEENVSSKTGGERAKAHQLALQDEAEVTKLNDLVFPHDDATKESAWHHETSEEMQDHWKNIASSTAGVAEDEPVKNVVAAPVTPTKKGAHAANTAHAKHAANKAAKKAAAAKKDAPVHKETAHEEAAAEEARHELINDDVFPKEASTKWHQEGADAMFKHFAAVSDDASPKERKFAYHHETAVEMAAEHAKETDKAFPKRWAKQEKKAEVVGHVNWHEKAVEHKEKAVNSKVWGKKNFRKMDLEHKLLQDEQQTHISRANAAKKASQELSKINILNEEVFPASWSKKAAPNHEGAVKVRQRHAVHKIAMNDKKSLRKIYNPLHMSNAQLAKESHMPPSSDAPVPAAGTNVVFQHAHQAGYAKQDKKKMQKHQ